MSTPSHTPPSLVTEAATVIGIAHPTKSKVDFGCMGKAGCFDDLKIWNAAPAK